MKMHTEREMIDLLIELGISKGEEFEKAYYMKHGYLNNDRTLKGFITKLEQVFESVELAKGENGKVLKGKKRMYVVGKRKDHITERITGNQSNGKKHSEYIQQIKQHLLHHLYYNQTKYEERLGGFTISTLARDMGIQLASDVAINETYYKEQILEYFDLDEQAEFMNAEEILDTCITGFSDRQKRVVEIALELLEADELIETGTGYMALKANIAETEHVAISKQVFMDIKNYEAELLSAMGISRQDFHFRKRKYKAVQIKINQEVAKKYGYEYAYKTIKLIKNNIHEDLIVFSLAGHQLLSVDEFIIQDFLKLTDMRVNYFKNKTSTFFVKRYYTLATYKILELLGHGKHINSELKYQLEYNYEEDFQSYQVDFYYYYIKANSHKFNLFGQAQIDKKVAELCEERKPKMKLHPMFDLTIEETESEIEKVPFEQYGETYLYCEDELEIEILGEPLDDLLLIDQRRKEHIYQMEVEKQKNREAHLYIPTEGYEQTKSYFGFGKAKGEEKPKAKSYSDKNSNSFIDIGSITNDITDDFASYYTSQKQAITFTNKALWA